MSEQVAETSVSGQDKKENGIKGVAGEPSLWAPGAYEKAMKAVVAAQSGGNKAPPSKATAAQTENKQESQVSHPKVEEKPVAIVHDMRLSQEIINRYFTEPDENEESEILPEANKAIDIAKALIDCNVAFCLLRYGKIDPKIPELVAMNYRQYGYDSEESMYDIGLYALHHKLEVAIVAGHGILMVRVPFTLNPIGRLAEFEQRGLTSSADMVSSYFAETLAVSDIHKNVIFIFKYSGELSLPSKTFKNGIEVLNSGEIVKPTEVLRYNKGVYEFENTEDLETFYKQDGYKLNIEGLFKGRVDEELRILKNYADQIFCYKDESGTPLAVIGDRAYDIESEKVKGELFGSYYDKTAKPPNTANLKRIVEIMKHLISRYGLTLENAPFKRDIVVVEKKKEFAEQFAEILRAVQNAQRVSMMSLEDLTGINGRVIGRRLKEPEIKAMINQLTGLGYKVTRDPITNNSVIELEKVGDTWQAVSSA